MKKIILCLISVFVLVSCTQINRYFGVADDNFIEEVIEWIFENKTGIDIDLTPFSTEM